MTTLEPIKNKSSDVPPPIPADLSVWLDKRSIVSLVLDAVLTVEDSALRPVAPATAGIAFRPRTMLALLTYCYAMGIYGSENIEEVMYRDAIFRYFCGNEIPDWKSLKRFRRHNHEAIQKCLEEVCSCASSVNSRRCDRLHRGPAGPPAGAGSARYGDVERAEMAGEAERRIELAMWIDHMTLDD
jgi:transposase